MSENKKVLGFGVIPEENEQHFLVIIPKTTAREQRVKIYERYYWQTDQDEQVINLMKDKLKADISKIKWDMISNAVEIEFKSRLKEKNIAVYRQAKWKTGDNPVERLMGKELLLLVWAIEDCQTSVIDTAVRNWKGLDIVERWWLYNITNAATGGVDDRRGWRKAIKYALTENPIEEESQGQLNLFKLDI